MRFVAVDGPGSRPAKRNAGWRAASGALVAFTDDDCRPDPGWLEALLAARPATIGVRPGADRAGSRTSATCSSASPAASAIDAPTPWYETCNIAYPRAAARAARRLRRALRRDRRGHRPRAARDRRRVPSRAGRPRPSVRHAVFGVPLHRAIGSGWSGWQTTPLIFREHPAHRRFLTARVFRNRDPRRARRPARGGRPRPPAPARRGGARGPVRASTRSIPPTARPRGPRPAGAPPAGAPRCASSRSPPASSAAPSATAHRCSERCGSPT